MPYLRTRRAALLLLSAVLSACDSTAPTTGTLEVNVVITGTDIDADGLFVTVDGGSGQGFSKVLDAVLFAVS
jgi:hypothetical protein